MKIISKFTKLFLFPLFSIVFLSLIFCSAPNQCYGDVCTIEIDVAPNVLNIQSNGQVVTVHTDIPYWSVDVLSVYLQGVFISSWKADDCGNFVAKFLMEEIKGLVDLDILLIDEYNTLTLIGETKSGEAFSGTQDIKVIDNVPSGR